MEAEEHIEKIDETLPSPIVEETPKREDILINSLDELCQNIAKGSPGKKALIGGIAGLTFGILGKRVGKVVGFTSGCTLLLVQIASYTGYSTVDWKYIVGSAVAKDVKRQKEPMDNKRVKEFVENNADLIGGFITGCLFAMSSG